MAKVPSMFRVVHSAGSDWKNLTDDCLNQLGVLPRGANIGFLYMTDSLDEDVRSILNRLKARTKIQHWIGTVGFGICASGVELFDLPAMAIMVGSLPNDEFCVLPVITPEKIELPDYVTRWSEKNQPVLGIVHSDPRVPRIEETLSMIQNRTGCFLVGGMTASRGACEQVADAVGDGGVSGILFGSGIAAFTGLTQGCTPIGGVHTVTAVDKNVVRCLDDRPAFEVFHDEIGELLARDLSRVQGYVHVALPIAGSDVGDYVVRNLIGLSPDSGSLAIGARLEVGDSLMFVRRDGASANTDLKKMVIDLKERSDGAPRAVFYFSCVARGPNLFGAGSVELKIIESITGNLPLIGFFANGEISNNRLYGYTGVLTFIG